MRANQRKLTNWLGRVNSFNRWFAGCGSLSLPVRIFSLKSGVLKIISILSCYLYKEENEKCNGQHFLKEERSVKYLVEIPITALKIFENISYPRGRSKNKRTSFYYSTYRSLVLSPSKILESLF